MEDMSELFKRHFNLLHKGTTMAKSVQDRKEVHNNARKEKRDTLALTRRNIDKNLGPVTPATLRKRVVKKNENTIEIISNHKVPEKNVKVSSTAKAKAEGVSKRLELLRKWKADKAEQKKILKANAKPIFKVCHVSSATTVDIENANKLIKGKLIVPVSASKKTQFAPPNHQFNPPRGIKPLNFSTATTKTQTSGICSMSGPRKLNITPQKKTSDLIMKPSAESSSKVLKGSKLRQVSAVKENKAKSTEPETKKNLKASAKPAQGKSKDKDDKLMEEVKKKNPSTLNKPKNLKTNQESKKAGASNTSTRPITRNTKKVSAEKPTNTIANVQKNSKKGMGFKITSAASNESSSSDIPNTITYRKTLKTSKIVFTSDQDDLNLTNLNISKETTTLDDINEENPKSNTHNISQVQDNSSNSDVFLHPTAQPIENVGSTSSASTDYSVDYNNCNSSAVSASTGTDYKTPPPVYVSPFVTISRGKDSARKEYQIRRSQGKVDFDTHTPEVIKILTARTSPKDGAAYFKRLLDREVDKITALCKNWEAVLTHPDLPEEAESSIDVTIGQSRLLMSKKFQQFRGLIAQCETEKYEVKAVTCEDLHGFWDMIFMQVQDLEKRFSNLQKMKDNNWKEILPQKAVPLKRVCGRPKKVRTKSKLLQIIQDARRKQKEQENEQILSGDILVNEDQTSLKERRLTETSSTKRRSLRASILDRKNHSRYSSSPGLTIMKVSQSIKQGDGLTPVRSILKSDVFRSTGKKSVVFQESIQSLSKTNLFCEQDKENISGNLIDFSPAPLTIRRSSRISKNNMKFIE